MASALSEELLEQLLHFARARNWEQFHTPKNLAMALSAEAGELLAEFQWLTNDESDSAKEAGELRARVTDELADVTIYLVLLADRLSIDLEEAASEKLRANAARFTKREGESWLTHKSDHQHLHHE